jgi:hypothetical protein
MGDLAELLIALLVLPVLVIGGYVTWLAVAMRSRRAEDGGFEYIYVDDEGVARELTDAEKQRVGAEYARDDSRRPYIKLRYESRDDLGRRRGFLKRRQLPAGVPIQVPSE